MESNIKLDSKWYRFIDVLRRTSELQDEGSLGVIFIGEDDVPLDEICLDLRDGAFTVQIISDFSNDITNQVVNVFSEADSKSILIFDFRGQVFNLMPLLHNINMSRNEFLRDGAGFVVFLCYESEYPGLSTAMPDVWSVRSIGL